MDRNGMGRNDRESRQGYEDRDRMRSEDRFAQQGLDRDDRGWDQRGSGRYGNQQYGYGQDEGMNRGYDNDDQRGMGSYGRTDQSWGQRSGNQGRGQGMYDQDRYGPDRYGQDRSRERGWNDRGWDDRGWNDRSWEDRGRMDSGSRYGGAGQSGWGDRSRSETGSSMWDRQGSQSGRGYGQGGMGQHAGKGPKGYQRDPQRIIEEVSERMASHPDLDASEVEVKCDNGEVTLTGSVTDRHQKRMAEECAEGVSGVKDVHNQIRVQAQGQQNMGQEGMGQQGMGGTSATDRQAKGNESRQRA